MIEAMTEAELYAPVQHAGIAQLRVQLGARSIALSQLRRKKP
ncbi:hypothetical protein [Aeromonas veronii]|nr:hypothetical protein [Aeromonas veronii]